MSQETLFAVQVAGGDSYFVSAGDIDSALKTFRTWWAEAFPQMSCAIEHAGLAGSLVKPQAAVQPRDLLKLCTKTKGCIQADQHDGPCNPPAKSVTPVGFPHSLGY